MKRINSMMEHFALAGIVLVSCYLGLVAYLMITRNIGLLAAEILAAKYLP